MNGIALDAKYDKVESESIRVKWVLFRSTKKKKS